MAHDLEAEFNYYLANRQALLQRYHGKFIVIRGQAVHGSYKTEKEAIEGGMKSFALGTFIVQQCTEGKDSYTRFLRSRAAA